ncbi:hypothetical protein [Oceanidesulfovibrio marinus]|uniref:Uncharacterized protein n=1 Tax=Oceanidesulfovibrio marinus TaxID=370038 RepID=A0A6P1ZBY5_9BACT|nr:hypothetical protein [Oceanidesulfovibrio marinus]TVM31198.1 hypothetical protein DQK91_18990 [Oceanidesulfovibrio marinus]
MADETLYAHKDGTVLHFYSRKPTKILGLVREKQDHGFLIGLFSDLEEGELAEVTVAVRKVQKSSFHDAVEPPESTKQGGDGIVSILDIFGA